METQQFNPIYLRIRQRLDEMHEDMSDRAASMIATNGKNADLLRKLRDNPKRKPSGDSLLGLQKLLNTSSEWILKGTLDLPTPTTGEVIDLGPVSTSHNNNGGQVPVLGTAMGSVIISSDGATPVEGFELSEDEPVEFAPAPKHIASQKGIYCIRTAGDSMDPMHPHGKLRYVQRHREPNINDTVIVRTRTWDGDPGQSYIKTLKRRTSTHLVLQQYNPPAMIEIPRKFVVFVHRVVPYEELISL